MQTTPTAPQAAHPAPDAATRNALIRAYLAAQAARFATQEAAR